MNALRPSFAMLDQWLGRDETPVLNAVQPGSRMAVDDAATAPHHLSHAVLSALSHGIDHLHCFRSLIVDAQALHVYAPFSLLRAAFENFSTVLWLLEPDDRETRVQRRLQLAAANIRYGEDVRRLAQEAGEDQSERRLGDVAAIAVSAGVPADRILGRTPGYESIVRGGAAATALSADTLVLVWKTCSGITHGQSWASLGVLEREITQDDESGEIVRLQLSAPNETVVLLAQTATLLCRDAWRLFDRHRLAWREHDRRT